MQCPACEVAFHDRKDEWETAEKRDDESGDFYWVSILTNCPECFHPILRIARQDRPIDDYYDVKVVYPTHSRAVSLYPEVPKTLADDYRESVLVLGTSSKASAALSRRILQAIFYDRGYTSYHLPKQMNEALSETDPDKRLPHPIAQTLKAVMEFGNFAAHPKRDCISSQIIEVEPDEAEWCVKVVEALFEHYYIRPAEDARRFADLEVKKARAGEANR